VSLRAEVRILGRRSRFETSGHGSLSDGGTVAHPLPPGRLPTLPEPAQASPEKGDAPPPTTTHHSLQCEEPAKAVAIHFRQGELEP